MTTTKRLPFTGPHGITTRAELLASGLSPAAIRHRLDRGLLHPLFPGVYAIGRPQVSREGWWLAAVFAAGPGAALSHRAAARLWEILEHGGGHPDVVVPSQGGRRTRRGMTVHRCATLRPADVTRRDGIPVTTLARTLVDLAGVVDDRTLRAAVRRAAAIHRLDLVALRRQLDQPRREPRRARLRATLDRWVPGLQLTESEFEAHFLALCARHRLPLPEPQVRIGDHRADFLWEAQRLVVETDSARWHDTDAGRGDDYVKERALRAAGYEVLRFTRAEVINQPALVAREIRRTLARRA